MKMTSRSRLVFAMVCLVLVGMLFGCKEVKPDLKNKPPLEQKVIWPDNLDVDSYNTVIGTDSVGIYTISNKNGLKAVFTNYGQRLISLFTPDREGTFSDIVLGFKSLEQYRASGEKYFGAVIGRYGNRIAQGKFALEGRTYQLALNNNNNHLHGGIKGFEGVVWKLEEQANNKLVFSRRSPHMEEGYPGNLDVQVTYHLTDDDELKISYEAVTDRSTIVNLTHHSFFNLKGEGQGTVEDHKLTINADYFVPVDEELIPLGTFAPVTGSPFDFRQEKLIGKDLMIDHPQLRMGNGYDHCFILNASPKNEAGLLFAARVVAPANGRTMEVYTDEPGMQFYGGNFLDDQTIGKSGMPYGFRGAFCLETQHFPDTPNQPSFPSVVLRPGEKYTSQCVYKFGISD